MQLFYCHMEKSFEFIKINFNVLLFKSTTKSKQSFEINLFQKKIRNGWNRQNLPKNRNFLFNFFLKKLYHSTNKKMHNEEIRIPKNNSIFMQYIMFIVRAIHHATASTRIFINRVDLLWVQFAAFSRDTNQSLRAVTQLWAVDCTCVCFCWHISMPRKQTRAVFLLCCVNQHTLVYVCKSVVSEKWKSHFHARKKCQQNIHRKRKRIK